VLGSGPHVLRKIETYNGKTIAYSLGNFVGGNNSLNTIGVLGVSGIFSAQFENNIETAHDFLSVQLSSSGVPSVDEINRGRNLIEELSI
jgi:poly-gamma-glutamate capsule biosynthesis protein CapA/YwtB (metallophosphatase superfamily)